MAAPTFVGAGTGVVITGATGTVTCDAAGQASGDLVVLQLLRDGTGATPTLTAGAGMSNLAGTPSALTILTPILSVGSPTAATCNIRVGRLNGGSPATLSVSAATDDIYARFYVFRGVHTGAALTDVIENGTAGVWADTSGTGTSVTDSGVTTLGADRLALQLVAVNDDVAIGPFTAMTGGTWAEAVAEYATATGTDGCIQLQTATIASAGTINGGAVTIASAGWGVTGFALIPVSSGPATIERSAALTGG